MKRMILLAGCLLFAGGFHAIAQKKKAVVAPSNEPLKTATLASLESSYPAYKNIALQIWDNAELGYKEVKSSALLQETLKKEAKADAESTKKAVKNVQSKVEKSTLGDIDALAALKDKMKKDEESK